MKNQYQIVMDVFNTLKNASNKKLIIDENVYNQIIKLVDDFIKINSKEKTK